MIRCREKLLRNRDKIQSESATKGYVQDINLSETENAVCVPVRTVLASGSTVHRKQTGCDNGHYGKRNGGRELLFGDGAVEHTLDG